MSAMALGSAWFAANKRGFATGIVSGGIGLGIFLSGLILSSFETDGWRYSWYILGFIVLLVAVLVFFLLRNHPSEKGLLPVGQAPVKGTQDLPAPG